MSEGMKITLAVVAAALLVPVFCQRPEAAPAEIIFGRFAPLGLIDEDDLEVVP